MSYDQLTADVIKENAELKAKIIAQEEELKEAIKEAAKWRRIRKPTHGSCCTCQGCGLHHDECRCDLDEVCDELDQLKAENQALKTKGEQLCCRVGVLEMENQALRDKLEQQTQASQRIMQNMITYGTPKKGEPLPYPIDEEDTLP